jgi:hypothetical protein
MHLFSMDTDMNPPNLKSHRRPIYCKYSAKEEETPLNKPLQPNPFPFEAKTTNSSSPALCLGQSLSLAHNPPLLAPLNQMKMAEN